MKWQKYYIFLYIFFSFSHTPLYAGSQQEQHQAILNLDDVIPFAKQVERYAAQKGAQVFVIARLGSPQSDLPEGIDFTHIGLAVYSDIQISETETIQGYAIHNLYQDSEAPNISRLVMDYPVDFFMGAVELKAGLLIPSPRLQQKILRSMALGRYTTLHNKHYSIVSNPYSGEYQNCTEHILDLIFSSLYETDSLLQIKANQQAYFHAHKVHISPFKRLLAPIFHTEIAMQDQGKVIQVATFTSISKFLRDYGLLQSIAIMDKKGLRER